MDDIASDRAGPMLNPPHLGELIRGSMDEVGWNVTGTAARLLRLILEKAVIPYATNAARSQELIPGDPASPVS